MSGRAYPEGLEEEETPLGIWMKEVGVSKWWVAKEIGCSYTSVQDWCCGTKLPGLIYAFKIEALSRGRVPASSWLTTTLAKRMMTVYGHSEERNAGKQTQRHTTWRKKKRAELKEALANGSITPEQYKLDMERVHGNRKARQALELGRELMAKQAAQRRSDPDSHEIKSARHEGLSSIGDESVDSDKPRAAATDTLLPSQSTFSPLTEQEE